MRRRDFILLLGGAAAATLPRTARAETAPRRARVGYLTLHPPGAEEAALTEGLNDLGWTEGRNITIDRRICSGEMGCLEKSAVELVDLKPDVIVAVATSGVQAVRNATTSIPIVMAATGDPVGQGFVASLARPGGHITGTSFDAGPEITTKQLQLILDVVPKASRIAVLWNPTAPFIRTYWKYAQDAAPALHVTLQSVELVASKDFDRAFDAMVHEQANALFVLSDSLMTANRVTLAELAADRKIPALYGNNLYAESGGLMSYGPSVPDLVRGAASYVDKILKGAKPADLPVQQPVKFELIINLKTAKALDLQIQPTLLARADRVIE
jgi:putative tryptophan/tyrosine transport system substrate-binding protein